MFLLASGCLRYTPLDGTEPSSTPPGDTVVTDGADPEVLHLEKRSSKITPTVITVSWDTLAPSEGWVAFGPDADTRLSTPPQLTPTTHHRFQVAGFPEGSSWHWRAVSRIDGVEVSSADQVHTSGTAPADLPRLDLANRVDGAWMPGYRLLTLIAETGGVVVLDDDGAVVWWHQTTSPETVTQARFAPDGSGVWYLVGDSTRTTDIGEIRYQRWDGAETLALRAEWAHHDFVILPDGRLAWIAVDIRDYLGESVVGDVIMEMNADGTGATPIWSTWDHIDLPDLASCSRDFYPQGCDWTHANSLWYDPSDDSYTLSIHNLDLFAKIDAGDHTAGSGTTTWLAGSGPASDFSISPPEASWEHQHAVKPVGGGEYLLFDNGKGVADSWSEIWRFRMDEQTRTAEAIWGFDYGGERNSIMLGDIQPLPNGNYLTSWGSEGEVAEISPAKEVVWEAYASLGSFLGFIGFGETLGGPLPETAD